MFFFMVCQFSWGV